MAYTRLQQFLEQQHVAYETIRHRTAFSAQQTAATAHVPGQDFAKAVIVDMDGRLVMVVQTANRMVPLGRLKAATGAEDVHIASECEFQDLFPDCELGAMPPFGNLYGMDTYVTESLTRDEGIVFNGGTHSELVRLRYADFDRLVHPTVI
jgi:Ala-tRNA(Pro) deacylase